uniref:PUM-HD domain-containing protein n=1 Tax=Oryza meridionalis TaxID=40149 RepID=A0A0E0EXS2_9ORYZ
MFLHNSIECFPIIAADKFGSRVAEAALKSLATHVEDNTARGIIQDVLDRMCKVIVADAANVMSSRHGSHGCFFVFSLQDLHTTKRSAVLAERLSCGRSGRSDPKNQECGFPDIFNSLVREMLQNAKDDILTLQTDDNSSLVLQTVLQLSAGDDHELNYIISILLGFDEDDTAQKKDCSGQMNVIMALLEHAAYGYLLEVIMEVAPDELRNNMLTGTLKGALFVISSHHNGNYVVEALVASARTSHQMERIWDELGSKIKELLESSQALFAAFSSNSESPESIVTHILFLENYLHQKLSWKWPLGAKMSVLGCLMLQTILQYPHQYIRPYVASFLAMDGNKILQISKDPGGSRILEAFLCSNASKTRKSRVFAKLRGHYGEIAMSPSGSLLLEKYFAANNLPCKQAIVVELLAVQTELSRTEHGFLLLKKLDVDRPPEQLRASKTSEDAGTSVPFLRNSGKRKSPENRNITSPVPANLMKQSIAELGYLAGKEELTASKQSIAELVDLAGKEKLSAVRCANF